MEVGLQVIFTAYGYDDSVTDQQVYDEEVTMVKQAEGLGFETIWPVEHHFFDYSFCPDNLEFLAYIAGCTENISLGTAAVILPWNDPIRVAEKVSLLDQLSGGRVKFGMGRGLSRREFAPFRGIELEETRDRFDEASLMIVAALETGFMEGDGPYYPQPRAEIRPRPARSFKNRIYAVANSSDSVDACARIGGAMILFAETHWDKRMAGIKQHRDLFKELHGRDAPPIMTADFCFCHADEKYAREQAEQYLAIYLQSLLEHYELMGDHLGKTKGYTAYGKQAEILKHIGFDKYVQGFLASNAYGTPGQILDKLKDRHEQIGSFELATCFRFGGIPFDEADASMQLFAAEVLPEIKGWD